PCSFSPTLRPPPRSTLFPYTTLFRSICREAAIPIVEDNPYGMLRFEGDPLPCLRELDPENVIYLGTLSKVFSPGVRIGWVSAERSEEHTSELQSLRHLVCRLLLEKKK